MPTHQQSDDKEAALRHMAAKTADRPFFMGEAIKRYQEHNQLDRNAVANWLDVTDGQLTRLELCGVPDQNEPKHSQDVADIAAKFGLDPAKLETILAVGNIETKA